MAHARPSRALAAAALALWNTAAVANDAIALTVLSTVQQPLAIANDFVGVSFEINAAPTFFTFNGTGVRQSYVNLLSTLQQQSGGYGPNVRIGGSSADWNAYLPYDQPLPPGYRYHLNDTDLATYAPAINAFRGTMTLDVTMRNATDPSLAVAHVQGIGRTIGWDTVSTGVPAPGGGGTGPASRYLIDGCEISNEPDIYWNDNIRPANYSYPDYAADYALYVGALKAAGLPDRVQGPVFCCNVARFDAGLYPNASTGSMGYVAQYGGGQGGAGLLSSISYHRYPVWYVHDVNYSIYWLLSDESSYQYFGYYLTPLVAAAVQAGGLPVYVGEGGGASDNGTNVVDVYAVCLWAVDALFYSASIGVQRFNFHGGPNDWLGPVMYPNPALDVPQVRPLWYAMWAFTEASANASVIYNVSITSSTNPYIKVWSVRDGHGVWRVVVIHKDPNPVPSTATVTITPPTPLSGTASLKRLLSTTPAGLNARTGITWGGQTYDGSADGLPVGTPVIEPVQPSQPGGPYVFSLPSWSVAMLTLPAA